MFCKWIARAYTLIKRCQKSCDEVPFSKNIVFMYDDFINIENKDEQSLILNNLFIVTYIYIQK